MSRNTPKDIGRRIESLAETARYAFQYYVSTGRNKDDVVQSIVRIEELARELASSSSSSTTTTTKRMSVTPSPLTRLVQRESQIPESVSMSLSSSSSYNNLPVLLITHTWNTISLSKKSIEFMEKKIFRAPIKTMEFLDFKRIVNPGDFLQQYLTVIPVISATGVYNGTGYTPSTTPDVVETVKRALVLAQKLPFVTLLKTASSDIRSNDIIMLRVDGSEDIVMFQQDAVSDDLEDNHAIVLTDFAHLQDRPTLEGKKLFEQIASLLQ
jgi:hypothetical protein